MISKVYRTKNRPVAAFAITLTGGTIILLGGVFSMVFTLLANFLVGGSEWPVFIGAYSSGLLGLVSGAVVVLAAFKYNIKDKKGMTEWATAAIIFSVISLLNLGGLGVGFTLGLIGGLIGLRHGDW